MEEKVTAETARFEITERFLLLKAGYFILLLNQATRHNGQSGSALQPVIMHEAL